MITIRTLHSEDRTSIQSILNETGVFTDEEVTIAMELVDAPLQKPSQTDYKIHVAVSEKGSVIGYYCMGPTPLTVGTFDLYWIAVKPSSHNKGVGKQLLNHCENQVVALQGRLLLAETSSQPKYAQTRNFYLRNGYHEFARIKDYYKIDDDLVVYGKYVSQLRKVNP